MSEITLGTRTREQAAIYFEKSVAPCIRQWLPQSVETLEQALENYEKTLLPGADSYGRTILLDGHYIGDIWCYCIDPDDTPNAMLSYCIFEPEFWNRGIGTKAAALFLEEIRERFSLKSVGAFTYADHGASIRVLEKNGFRLAEEFAEDGRLSGYFEREL